MSRYVISAKDTGAAFSFSLGSEHITRALNFCGAYSLNNFCYDLADSGDPGGLDEGAERSEVEHASQIPKGLIDTIKSINNGRAFMFADASDRDTAVILKQAVEVAKSRGYIAHVSEDWINSNSENAVIIGYIVTP